MGHRGYPVESSNSALEIKQYSKTKAYMATPLKRARLFSGGWDQVWIFDRKVEKLLSISSFWPYHLPGVCFMPVPKCLKIPASGFQVCSSSSSSEQCWRAFIISVWCTFMRDKSTENISNSNTMMLCDFSSYPKIEQNVSFLFEVLPENFPSSDTA